MCNNQMIIIPQHLFVRNVSPPSLNHRSDPVDILSPPNYLANVLETARVYCYGI